RASTITSYRTSRLANLIEGGGIGQTGAHSREIRQPRMNTDRTRIRTGDHGQTIFRQLRKRYRQESYANLNDGFRDHQTFYTSEHSLCRLEFRQFRDNADNQGGHLCISLQNQTKDNTVVREGPYADYTHTFYPLLRTNYSAGFYGSVLFQEGEP